MYKARVAQTSGAVGIIVAAAEEDLWPLYMDAEDEVDDIKILCCTVCNSDGKKLEGTIKQQPTIHLQPAFYELRDIQRIFQASPDVDALHLTTGLCRELLRHFPWTTCRSRIQAVLNMKIRRLQSRKDGTSITPTIWLQLLTTRPLRQILPPCVQGLMPDWVKDTIP